jgi:arylformamidase
MKLIDVSVPLDARLPTYPGNTPFSLEPIQSIGRGDHANVSAIHSSVHAGTHVDAPRHFLADGAGVEALPLEMLCGRTRVIEVRTRKGITPDDLAGIDLSEDIRVLLKTHNSRMWGSPEFHTDFIGVTGAAAQHFVDRGVKLLGIDYLSIEVFRTPGAPAHHTLLSAGVIVVEGLNLAEVEPGVYDMFCLPLRLVGSDGAPARVILRRS